MLIDLRNGSRPPSFCPELILRTSNTTFNERETQPSREKRKEICSCLLVVITYRIYLLPGSLLWLQIQIPRRSHGVKAPWVSHEDYPKEPHENHKKTGAVRMTQGASVHLQNSKKCLVCHTRCVSSKVVVHGAPLDGLRHVPEAPLRPRAMRHSARSPKVDADVNVFRFDMGLTDVPSRGNRGSVLPFR